MLATENAPHESPCHDCARAGILAFTKTSWQTLKRDGLTFAYFWGVFGALVGLLSYVSTKNPSSAFHLDPVPSIGSMVIGALVAVQLFRWSFRQMIKKEVGFRHGSVVLAIDQEIPTWHTHLSRPAQTFPQGFLDQMLFSDGYRQIMPIWIELTLVEGQCAARLASTSACEELVDGWSVRIEKPLAGSVYITDPHGWTRSVDWGDTAGLRHILDLIRNGRNYSGELGDLYTCKRNSLKHDQEDIERFARNFGALVSYLESTKGQARGPSMAEVRKLSSHIFDRLISLTPQFTAVISRGDHIRQLVALRTELGLQYGAAVPTLTSPASSPDTVTTTP